MILKKDVHKNLILLDVLFNESRGKKLMFYSKLSVIELCGWIEAAMDDLILQYAKKNITNPADFKIVREKVKKNSNFNYEQFRGLCIFLVGLKRIRLIENKLDATGDLAVFTNLLDNLKAKRNSFAHTHVHGTITVITSPHSMLTSFHVVFRILKIYQRHINKY